jgi:fatty-acyl-CoA synthase
MAGVRADAGGAPQHKGDEHERAAQGVRGRADIALSDATIGALLADARRAFLIGSQRCSVNRACAGPGQLQAEVDGFATGLQALGLKAGDRVGTWSPNRVEWLVTQFATARIGVILVNINPAYRISELEYALNASGCRALVAAERLKGSDYLGMLQTLAPELQSSEPGRLTARRLPKLEIVVRMGELVRRACWATTRCWLAAARQCTRPPSMRSASH